MASIMDDVSMNPVGTHGSIDVTTSGTALTPPAGAQRLLFQPTSGTVRLMLVGTATATNGFLFVAGAVPYAVMLGADSAPSFAATAGTVNFMYQWVR
jgi:hypothetical protein